MRQKLFLVSFLASLPFWFAVNIFADNVKTIVYNDNSSSSFLAKADLPPVEKEQKLEQKSEPEVKAKSAISLLIDKDGNEKVLFSKNADGIMPIASLTKIMTSKIILDNFDLSQEIIISEQNLLKRGFVETFKHGESFKAADLLYASFIESENDGITALTAVVGSEGFVSLMNLEAQHMGLYNTRFFNATGLDPIYIGEGVNYSTAKELAELSYDFFKKPVASNISLVKMYNLYASNGLFHHRSVNTNEMLDYFHKFGDFEIIGGKTGSTLSAGSCLVLALKNPKDSSYLINVVLNSENRYEDMEKMANWAVSSYDI